MLSKKPRVICVEYWFRQVGKSNSPGGALDDFIIRDSHELTIGRNLRLLQVIWLKSLNLWVFGSTVQLSWLVWRGCCFLVIQGTFVVLAISVEKRLKRL